jgi:hypothetical protein
MSLLDDLKAKADLSGDGSVNAGDLQALKDKYPDQSSKLDELKARLDTSGDGKLGFEDISGAFGNLGDTIGGLKDKLFGK